MSIVGSMDSVSVGQLLIDKACHVDLEFSDKICDNLLNDTFEHENAEVENEVAQYKVSLFHATYFYFFQNTYTQLLFVYHN